MKDPIHNLRLASKSLGDGTPGLNTGFTRLNQGLNALAFNPDGAAEGYLFYVPWLNHNLNAISTIQDAHGPIPRGLVEISCQGSVLAAQVASQDLSYETLLELNRVPSTDEIEALGGC